MSDVRVWAEERGDNELLLTWERGDSPDDRLSTPARDRASEARAVAATLGLLDGVSQATAVAEGVSARYDPLVTSKSDIAIAVRSALALDADLKTRANELLKRIPSYASVARSLALDDRVSPVPEVARQASNRRAVSGPLRMIPGFPIVAQLHTIAPMLRTLREWSRNASPEVVDEHLGRAGLTRDQLDRDLATSHEAMAFARSYAGDVTARAASKAVAVAAQARDAAREWKRERDRRAGERSDA